MRGVAGPLFPRFITVVHIAERRVHRWWVADRRANLIHGVTRRKGFVDGSAGCAHSVSEGTDSFRVRLGAPLGGATFTCMLSLSAHHNYVIVMRNKMQLCAHVLQSGSQSEFLGGQGGRVRGVMGEARHEKTPGRSVIRSDEAGVGE